MGAWRPSQPFLLVVGQAGQDRGRSVYGTKGGISITNTRINVSNDDFR